MVKIGFRANGSVYDVDFDEKRIIDENNLRGSFDQTISDNLRDNPIRKNESKLYNFGNGGWFASGTNFGIVSAGARILFDEDKNQTQNGNHFNIQGLVNVSGSKPYPIHVGDIHRIYSDKLEIIFYNFDGTISGTKVLTAPVKTNESAPSSF